VVIARLLDRILTPDLWGDRETETAILAGFRQMRARLDEVNADPHRYAPDWQAQGDCRLCGLGAEGHGANQGGLRK